MFPPQNALGLLLLAHARSVIAARLSLPILPPDEGEPALAEPGATFVTLKEHGRLRGCMGSLGPTRTLLQDVRSNALAAAFRDPRFLPVAVDEWKHIRLEISLLGPVAEKPCPTRATCLSFINPEYGVILTSGYHRSTFLPQVWEQLPDPDDLLDHLLSKAGMPPAPWPTNMMVGRYRVEKFQED